MIHYNDECQCPLVSIRSFLVTFDQVYTRLIYFAGCPSILDWSSRLSPLTSLGRKWTSWRGRLISCLPSHSCHPFPAFELDWPGARRKLMLAQRERNHGPINILALHIRAITILVSNVGIKNSDINVESNGRPCRTWPTMLNQYYSIRNHVPNPPFHALLQLYSMQIFSIIGTNWKEFALISYYTSFCNIPKNQLNLAKVRAKSSINIREEC